MTDQHQPDDDLIDQLVDALDRADASVEGENHKPGPGYTEVITPAALDAMTGTEVPLRDGPGGPVIGTARLAGSSGVVDMTLDVQAFHPEAWQTLARHYAESIDRLLAEQVDEQVDEQLEAAGYAVPRHLDVRKMTGLLPVSTELLQPGRVTVPAWRPSRRQRLAWWWQGVRERAGEWVAGRRFDAEDGDR